MIKRSEEIVRASDVGEFLSLLKINYVKEYSVVQSPESNSKLRFDYYCIDHNLMIEFDGKQHYERVEYFHPTELDFKKQQYYDEVKNEWCVSNGFKLLRISYETSYELMKRALVDALIDVRVAHYRTPVGGHLYEVSIINESRVDQRESTEEQLGLNEDQINYDIINGNRLKKIDTNNQYKVEVIDNSYQLNEQDLIDEFLIAIKIKDEYTIDLVQLHKQYCKFSQLKTGEKCKLLLDDFKDLISQSELMDKWIIGDLEFNKEGQLTLICELNDIDKNILMLNSNINLVRFFKYLHDNNILISINRKIPINVIYQIYINWMNKYNHKDNILSTKSFATEIELYLKSYSFRLSNTNDRLIAQSCFNHSPALATLLEMTDKELLNIEFNINSRVRYVYFDEALDVNNNLKIMNLLDCENKDDIDLYISKNYSFDLNKILAMHIIKYIKKDPILKIKLNSINTDKELNEFLYELV